MATAADLLKEVIDGASRARGNIQLSDVERVLGNETFTRDMLVTSESGNSLLHLAAQGHVESVLPLVVQAYKRAKLFSTAMAIKNGSGWNPLHVAVRSCNFENTVFLFKECSENYPEAFEPAENGWTVLHLAADGTENVNILKYLLSKDVCQPMLLVKCHTPRHKDALPLDIAKALVFKAEFEVQNAQRSLEFSSKVHGASFNKDFMYKCQVEPKKKALEKAKEVLSVIQQPTLEAKAKEAERLAMEIERKKFLEREEKIITELHQLLQLSSWSIILEKYMLCDSEETQKITMGFLAKSLSAETPPQLPPLSLDILKVMLGFLILPESDPALLSTLTLLGEFTRSTDNNKLLFASREESDLDIISKVVGLLCSLEKEIQCLCVSALLNLTTNKPDNFVTPEDWIQPLLLVNHFSLDDTAKSLATQTLSNLGVGDRQPDPGSWSVRDVSLWMENNIVSTVHSQEACMELRIVHVKAEFWTKPGLSLEKRSEYRKKFVEGGIDGLHLLELSTSEMTGLGVKFVSNQRKLSSLIDELRRMNMRSIVGQKDIFLSYAHINIHFARRIKKVLNIANYTVWIDEAGIRAGHKWRNEIADGIQGCRGFLFIMTPRSTNSEYCQDELALAEEYKKPIITLRLETVSEIDPGLKLIIQKRQWIDFMEESEFEVSGGELVNAICRTVGSGSGPEREDEEDTAKYTTESTEAPEANCEALPVSPLLGHNDPTNLTTMEKLVSASMATLGGELRGELRQLQLQMKRLEAKVDELSGKVQAIENRL